MYISGIRKYHISDEISNNTSLSKIIYINNAEVDSDIRLNKYGIVIGEI